MALRDTRGGREFDKFVADATGDTAMRMSVTSSVVIEVDSTAGTITLEGDTHIAEGSAITVLAATAVEGKERIGIQLLNTGVASAANRDTLVQVWGSLVGTPGSLPGTNWTQIGDNIDLNAATSAYKAIATTPIKWVAITAYLDDPSAEIDTTLVAYLMAD